MADSFSAAGHAFGVTDINRLIHEQFRENFLQLATETYYRRIPKPMGPERIVYGDKVINVTNHRPHEDRVYPKEGALHYLANGEIGIAVGWWRRKADRKSPKQLQVEFASQRGYTYGFYESDFKEEGEAPLELAYALTVHKAQGSEFGTVILLVPENHPIMSRELIYTALTRHKDRMIIMHQGARSALRSLADPFYSETARRRTNLLDDCKMVEVATRSGTQTRFLQEHLIHRTSDGRLVRSKSELLIAEALIANGIRFQYEEPLTLGGRTRYPDFTIVDDISGRTIYWEHLGMMDREAYRRAWEEKKQWYLANGIRDWQEDEYASLVLVTTTEDSRTGLDMTVVREIVERLLG